MRAVIGYRQIELAQDPAVGHLVIERYRVAVVISGVGNARQQLAHSKLRHQLSARLVVYPHAHVGDGDDVVRAHCRVRVRGDKSGAV
jgi:hypothetical protein